MSSFSLSHNTYNARDKFNHCVSLWASWQADWHLFPLSSAILWNEALSLPSICLQKMTKSPQVKHSLLCYLHHVLWGHLDFYTVKQEIFSIFDPNASNSCSWNFHEPKGILVIFMCITFVTFIAGGNNLTVSDSWFHRSVLKHTYCYFVDK